jgi:hypothetical protein
MLGDAALSGASVAELLNKILANDPTKAATSNSAGQERAEG